ncbi:MAG: hypothetical protein WC839_03830 [Candidatus Paceibacterota bacterium]
MNKISNKLITLGLEILVIFSFSLLVFLPKESKAYTPFYPTYLKETTTKTEVPKILSIKPNSINKNEITNKITITISGYGFTPNSIIRKNNSNRTTTFIDSKNLLVDIYANDLYSQKEFFLTVFNSDVTNGYSNAYTFTIKDNTITNNTTNNPPIDYSSAYSNTQPNQNPNINNQNNIPVENNDTVSSANTTNEGFGSLTANALVGSNGFMPSGLIQWIFLVLIVILIIYLWRYIHNSEEKYMSEPMKHA